MGDPIGKCAHGRFREFDTLHGKRGWRCLDCDAAGPTMIAAVFKPGGEPAGLRGSCVCGGAYAWPATATGGELGGWLAEHARCELPEPVREEADRYLAAIGEALSHLPNTIACGAEPDDLSARVNAVRDVLRKAVAQ